MKNKVLVIVTIIVSVLAILSLVGCVSASKVVTPAKIDTRAVEYTGNEPDEYKSFLYPNLSDAEKLSADVESTHQLNTLAWQQKIDADKLKYSQIKEVVTFNREQAQALENNLFSEQGFLTLGLSALGFGLPAGVIGLLRKRPQDITPEEFKTAIYEAGLKDPYTFKRENGLG